MKIWTDYIHILTALLVITNPIGALPVFMTLTRDQTLAARKNTARITATAVAIVLVVSMFLGEPLLRFFGIGLPSFRVGGGILIMMMAIAMLRGYPGETRHTPEERIDAEEQCRAACGPLPVLAPSAPRSYAHQAAPDGISCFAVRGLAGGGQRLGRPVVGPHRQPARRYGISVATRVMGLILAAVAVEFIAGGLVQLFPSLG